MADEFDDTAFNNLLENTADILNNSSSLIAHSEKLVTKIKKVQLGHELSSGTIKSDYYMQCGEAAEKSSSSSTKEIELDYISEFCRADHMADALRYWLIDERKNVMQLMNDPHTNEITGIAILYTAIIEINFLFDDRKISSSTRIPIYKDGKQVRKGTFKLPKVPIFAHLQCLKKNDRSYLDVKKIYPKFTKENSKKLLESHGYFYDLK